MALWRFALVMNMLDGCFVAIMDELTVSDEGKRKDEITQERRHLACSKTKITVVANFCVKS